MMQITIHMIEINNTQLYVYKYKHYIYFHAHIDRYISIKVNIIHIFHMNIHSFITFFHRRFVYSHTFFCSKIMCSCQLLICLYNISRASSGNRLYHSRVAPSVPIWTEFTSHQGHLYSIQILRQIGACGLRRLEDSVSTSTALLRNAPAPRYI